MPPNLLRQGSSSLPRSGIAPSLAFGIRFPEEADDLLLGVASSSRPTLRLCDVTPTYYAITIVTFVLMDTWTLIGHSKAHRDVKETAILRAVAVTALALPILAANLR